MTTNLDTANWWGGEGRFVDRPSLLGLIDNSTMDSKTAAMLWCLIENKTSVISAALPQKVGKTALLTTLLDFAPPQYEKILTRGNAEDFSFLKSADPSKSYILVPEFSDHTPAYLWGDRVRSLFEALRDGYSVFGTMHADTPEDVLNIFRGFPVFIPPTPSI